METRPSGTVTFLFSDIEGSTRLWQHHREAMEAGLRRHDSLMRSAIRAHDGYVFSTAGDALAAAFTRAGQAVDAAVEAQRALAAIDWGPAEIKVRVGIHTGEADERDGDYFGPTLNRGARLMAAAHGGQVLVSAVTAGLVADRLPDRVTLVDLGAHRLKDLDVPERVFQVADATLDRAFPALRTLEAVANNLPQQLAGFIGRQRAVGELAALVSGHRLVTLTGVGGVGKTRLALQVGAEILDRYRDGVWFIELAGIADPALIPKQVAVAMAVQEQANRPIESTLVDRLRGREALVLLDNCEHVIHEAAAFVARLLRSTTAISVLATSREALGIPGETVWTVPPMSLPEMGKERLAANEAIGLFVDRARLVDRAFTFTVQNASACVEICRGLDGVPLAIELAAARVGVLSPRQIADRLGDRLALLSKGARTAAARQQTLRAAIDWSYDLLSPHEQALLRRLAVFRGGFTLDAVEALWSLQEAPAPSALDLLELLVDKSLVMGMPRGQDRRFGLLETIRAYAWDRLENADEADTMRERHRAFFLEWANRQSRLVSTRDQLEALAALEVDHDNLRVVLEWSFAKGDVDAALLLAADLSFFWFVHSHFGESGAWYQKLLAERDRVAPRARIKLLLGAGQFSLNTGDHVRAADRFEEAHRLAQQAGSPRMEGWALYHLSSNRFQQMEFDDASRLAGQALERFQAAGDPQGIGLATFTQAGVELLARSGTWSVRAEDAQEFLVRLGPMLDVARAVGELDVLGHALETLGGASVSGHRYGDGAALLAEAVEAFDTLGNQSCLTHSLDRVAWLAEMTARSHDSVRLLAASDALRERIGIAATPVYGRIRDLARAAARARLSTQDFDTAWRQGAGMDRRRAVELALEIARSAGT